MGNLIWFEKRKVPTLWAINNKLKRREGWRLTAENGQIIDFFRKRTINKNEVIPPQTSSAERIEMIGKSLIFAAKWVSYFRAEMEKLDAEQTKNETENINAATMRVGDQP
jgi:hypothetical protein